MLVGNSRLHPSVSRKCHLPATDSISDWLVSLEFFAFPGYMNDVAATTTCLQNFKALTGVWPPLRIGGTTQYVYKKSSAYAACMLT
jgi:hypothetical protein